MQSMKAELQAQFARNLEQMKKEHADAMIKLKKDMKFGPIKKMGMKIGMNLNSLNLDKKKDEGPKFKEGGCQTEEKPDMYDRKVKVLTAKPNNFKPASSK